MNPDERLHLRDFFKEVLEKAGEQRQKRSQWVNGELAWVAFERQQMFAAVTSERARRGKPPLPITEVERVERQAVGHSDYWRKFSLYCAELVLDG